MPIWETAITRGNVFSAVGIFLTLKCYSDKDTRKFLCIISCKSFELYQRVKYLAKSVLLSRAAFMLISRPKTLGYI